MTNPAVPAPDTPPTDGQPPVTSATPKADSRLLKALDRERTARLQAEQQLAEHTEGERRAAQATRRQLAASEFRAAAAGKLANADSIVAALDLDQLLDADGNVDAAKIAETVGALTPPAPGRGPSIAASWAGVRQPVPPDGRDWLRMEMQQAAQR